MVQISNNYQVVKCGRDTRFSTGSIQLQVSSLCTACSWLASTNNGLSFNFSGTRTMLTKSLQIECITETVGIDCTTLPSLERIMSVLGIKMVLLQL